MEEASEGGKQLEYREDRDGKEGVERQRESEGGRAKEGSGE